MFLMEQGFRLGAMLALLLEETASVQALVEVTQWGDSVRTGWGVLGGEIWNDLRLGRGGGNDGGGGGRGQCGGGGGGGGR